MLWQKCGTNQGSLNPGCQPCWCGWNRVSHLVSKQLVTYNHMPKKCPTRDHVFVDIDLSVTLKINSSQVNKFVFEMGVERLDAYLSFQVEESIRGLVYDVNHDRVNDLRSEFASDMLAVLQQKVERFGVDIKAVKITNVALPRELQERLESTPASRRSRDFLREDGETSPPPRVAGRRRPSRPRSRARPRTTSTWILK